MKVLVDEGPHEPLFTPGVMPGVNACSATGSAAASATCQQPQRPAVAPPAAVSAAATAGGAATHCQQPAAAGNTAVSAAATAGSASAAAISSRNGR